MVFLLSLTTSSAGLSHTPKHLYYSYCKKTTLAAVPFTTIGIHERIPKKQAASVFGPSDQAYLDEEEDLQTNP